MTYENVIKWIVDHTDDYDIGDRDEVRDKLRSAGAQMEKLDPFLESSGGWSDLESNSDFQSKIAEGGVDVKEAKEDIKKIKSVKRIIGIEAKLKPGIRSRDDIQQELKNKREELLEDINTLEGQVSRATSKKRLMALADELNMAGVDSDQISDMINERWDEVRGPDDPEDLLM